MKSTAKALKPATARKNQERIKKSDFKHHLFIESFETIREILDAYLLDRFTETEPLEAAHSFVYRWNPSGKDSFSKNGKKLYRAAHREKMLDIFGSEVRRTIAEFAVGRVFIHSGVVSWKGRAIVIPAKSFRGKTSLIIALVKRGALYYSDEYAVLDEEGFVHPFPKTLSVRGIVDKYEQVECAVEEIGGKAAVAKARVGMFLITEYKPGGRWNPKVLSPANGILEIINHTLPIRANPVEVLKILNRAVSGAVIVKSNRGEASKFADLIIDFFEKNCF
jgi:hypothetical protein